MKKKVTSHSKHPGVKQDHHTLFVFWVLAIILLILAVALIRAAA